MSGMRRHGESVRLPGGNGGDVAQPQCRHSLHTSGGLMARQFAAVMGSTKSSSRSSSYYSRQLARLS